MTDRTLRNYIPFIGIQDGCILSKRGDLTFGWRVWLPTAYTVNEAGYNSILSSFIQAYKLLPAYCVVHKQDIYRYDYYRPEECSTYLSRSFEKHFEGRPFLNGYCYIFLTFSSKSNIENKSSSSGMFGILDSKVPDAARIKECAGIASTFGSVLDGNFLINLTPLKSEDFLRMEDDGKDGGLIPDYLRLYEPAGVDYPLEFFKDEIRCGANRARVWFVEDSDSYPGQTDTVSFQNSMSAGNLQVFLSGGASIGYKLDIPHVVNRYIVTLPRNVVESELDQKRRFMNSFSLYSAGCRVNAQEISAYLEASARESALTVKCFTSLMAWGPEQEIPEIRNRVVRAFSDLNIVCCEESVSAPQLHYAGIPGAGAELGYDFLMTSELNAFLCNGLWDGYDLGFSKGCIKLCDRNLLIPRRLDLQSDARDMGLIDNLNALVVGPSGSGKSFTMNTLVRNYYESGQHILIIDVGDSYEGQCRLINEETGGRDGVYNTYDPENPFGFNPFRGRENWDVKSSDGENDSSGHDFIMSLLQTMYVPHGGWNKESSNMLDAFLLDFFDKWDHGYSPELSKDLKAAYVNRLRLAAERRGELEDFDSRKAARGFMDPLPSIFPDDREKDPVFDDFYQYVTLVVAQLVAEGEYKVGNVTLRNDMFDIDKFGVALNPYRKGGKYGFFLNERNEKDLFSSRLTVFEVDKIKDNKDLFPLWVLCIMHSFEDKMRTLPCQKVMIIEEAWKAISVDTMANFIVWMWRTARKFRTSAVVVTQSVGDLLSSEIVKDAIIQNSSVKILLDQSKNANNFSESSRLLALSPKDVSLVLSVGRDLNPNYRYKEAFISIGERYSNVFAVEVSEEEALVYESDKIKKKPLFDLAARLGSFREAVDQMAGEMRNERRNKFNR